MKTKKEILIHLCELEGTKYHQPTPEEVKSGSYYQYETRFLESLDAIVPLVRKVLATCDVNTAYRFTVGVSPFEYLHTHEALFATPEQLCRAIVKATDPLKGDEEKK